MDENVRRLNDRHVFVQANPALVPDMLDEMAKNNTVSLLIKQEKVSEDLPSFLDAFFRSIRDLKKIPHESGYYNRVRKAHVFYLGDHLEAYKESDKICSIDRLPMLLPFDNMIMITRIGRQKWMATHLYEDQGLCEPERRDGLLSRFTINAPPPANGRIIKSRVWVQEKINDGFGIDEWWHIAMYGVQINYGETGFQSVALTSSPVPPWGTAEAFLRWKKDGDFSKYYTGPILLSTAISHPANYIVRVEPKMTDGEKRAEAAGKDWGRHRKHPHYIVIDHSEVTALNPANRVNRGGTHASPVPHHRRGHWMRLSARCRYLRERLISEGKEPRVPVRATIVGDVNFADEKNHYHVIMRLPGEGGEAQR